MDLCLQRIIDEMKLNGKKQYELTDYLGLRHATFGNWKKGMNSSYKKYIHAIADFLGVSVEYLRGETDVKQKPSVLSDRGQWDGAVKVLTPHEERLILAYRAQPALQAAVDKLLDIEEEASPSQIETA